MFVAAKPPLSHIFEQVALMTAGENGEHYQGQKILPLEKKTPLTYYI